MSRLPTLAAPLLLALLALPAHALDLGGNWTKSETRNLIVYSNAHDFTTKEIVTKLERMRGALGHIMGLRTESAVPVTIFVFDGEPAYAPVRKAVFGARASEQVGFFTRSGGRFFVVMEIDRGAGGDHVVYHEITHSLIENTAALPSPCFSILRPANPLTAGSAHRQSPHKSDGRPYLTYLTLPHATSPTLPHATSEEEGETEAGEVLFASSRELKRFVTPRPDLGPRRDINIALVTLCASALALCDWCSYAGIP